MSSSSCYSNSSSSPSTHVVPSTSPHIIIQINSDNLTKALRDNTYPIHQHTPECVRASIILLTFELQTHHLILHTASSSTPGSCGWANGVPPKSRKAKNRALQKLLPNHNQPICKSYSKFTRFLLGYTTTHQEYPDPPNDDQIMNLAPLTKEVIICDNSVFTTYNATAHCDRTEWSPFKALLLLDLDNYQLGDTFTFEWEAKEGEKSRWNQVMIYFTVKHWIFAHRASAFENFGMDCELPDGIIQIGIVTRWLIGRIEEMKSGFWDQKKVEQRTRSRKRREVSFLCF
jgi:hypothetical protein